MNNSDDVRRYCKEHYIDPARKSGAKTVEIVSGDVHRAMNYTARYPLVCSAIGANKFVEMCNVRRVAIEGPLPSANALFRFELL
jgi:5-methylcytosine-specific restriction protein B